MSIADEKHWYPFVISIQRVFIGQNKIYSSRYLSNMPIRYIIKTDKEECRLPGCYAVWLL
jgi:hypothetical protein